MKFISIATRKKWLKLYKDNPHLTHQLWISIRGSVLEIDPSFGIISRSKGFYSFIHFCHPHPILTPMHTTWPLPWFAWLRNTKTLVSTQNCTCAYTGCLVSVVPTCILTLQWAVRDAMSLFKRDFIVAKKKNNRLEISWIQWECNGKLEAGNEGGKTSTRKRPRHSESSWVF